MAKKGLPWFRFYADWLDNAKVQVLDATLQQRYIVLLCLRCRGEIPGLSVQEIAWHMRITVDECEETLSILTLNGLWRDRDVPNWDERQFVSDSSTDRSRKHRAAHDKTPQSNADATLHGRRSNGNATRSDSDSDSYMNPSDTSAKAAEEVALDPKAESATRLLRGLILENDARAKVPSLDSATWRTWVGDIHKIHRIDGRDWQEIDRVTRWCQADPFWKSNILSPAKLRKQFTTLMLKSQGGRRMEGFNERYA